MLCGASRGSESVWWTGGSERDKNYESQGQCLKFEVGSLAVLKKVLAAGRRRKRRDALNASADVTLEDLQVGAVIAAGSDLQTCGKLLRRRF